MQLCCALTIWLNLKAGVSRDTANSVLKALQFILSTTLGLLQIALLAHGIPLQLPKLQIPQDIRTAYSNYTREPEIVRTPCCPKCYTLYPSLANMPDLCTAKVSKKSRIRCKAELWRTQRFGKEYKKVPKTTFNTQKFEPWLEWFLSRKTIEDSLEKAFRRTPAGPGEEMCDLQDSPRWKNLKSAGKDKYNLVFGVYIDWFNPRSNRLAGMFLDDGLLLTLTLRFRKTGFLWNNCSLLPKSSTRNSISTRECFHCGINTISKQAHRCCSVESTRSPYEDNSLI